MSLLTLLRGRSTPVKKKYWENFSKLPSNVYFNHFNPNYDNERLLYDLLITEGYNKHGICCSYIITSFNTNYDKLFGEDNNRRYERRFKLMAYFDLPYEVRNFNNAGIGWSDVFHIYASIKHFNTASKYNFQQTSAIYSSYIPRVGDFLSTDYNNMFYEIISVKMQEEQFLQHQHSYDLIVRVYRDKSININPSTSGDFQDLSQYVGTEDIFNIGQFINEYKDEIVYKPTISECSPRDPFNDWF